MKKILVIVLGLALAGLGLMFVFKQQPDLFVEHDSEVNRVVQAPPAQSPMARHQPTPSAQHQALTSKSYSTAAAAAAAAVENLPRNYADFWATLDAGQYETVSEFSSRYSDGLQFYNRGQLAWMQRHGYPNPEDILAAQTVSDEKLAELAASGESTSIAMILDRKITQAADLGRDLLSRGHDPFAEMEFVMLTADVSRYTDLLYASGTPFAGYMDARATMEVFGVKTPEAEYGEIVEIALRGLAYAESNGDHLATNRALWLADEAGVDPGVFRNYVSYHSFLSSKRTVLCDPGHRIQDSMPYGVDP